MIHKYFNKKVFVEESSAVWPNRKVFTFLRKKNFCGWQIMDFLRKKLPQTLSSL